MDTFKRNQVEGAIAECLERVRRPGGEPNQALAVRLKRLIETDRELPLRAHGQVAASGTYAFFDEAPPGKGVEVTYSNYGAFGLYLAVRLMDAGMPQSEAVRFMRQIRREIEGEHHRILGVSPEKLIDHTPPGGLEREIRAGLLVRSLDHMTFLVVPADLHSGPTWFRRSADRNKLVNICRSRKELNEVIEFLGIQGPPIIALELTNPSHRLIYWLHKIEPIKRGRKA